MLVSDEDLRGRAVVAADGQVVGTVKGLVIEGDDWRVQSIRVALRREVAGQLGTGGLFRPGTLDIPVDRISAVGGTVILSVPVEGLVATLAPAPPERTPVHR